MKKKGFVLMETIVVISVLCVVLVILYGSYSKIIVDVKKKSLYNNTEYVYKTSVLRKYLEDNNIIPSTNYSHTSIYIYCSNTIAGEQPCYSDTVTGNYQNDIFKFMKVNSIYITFWNVSNIDASDIKAFEATTQNYIKTMDPTDEDGFRIIAMFESENNDTNMPVFEYGTLRFGDRR